MLLSESKEVILTGLKAVYITANNIFLTIEKRGDNSGSPALPKQH